MAWAATWQRMLGRQRAKRPSSRRPYEALRLSPAWSSCFSLAWPTQNPSVKGPKNAASHCPDTVCGKQWLKSPQIIRKTAFGVNACGLMTLRMRSWETARSVGRAHRSDGTELLVAALDQCRRLVPLEFADVLHQPVEQRLCRDLWTA